MRQRTISSSENSNKIKIATLRDEPLPARLGVTTVVEKLLAVEGATMTYAGQTRLHEPIEHESAGSVGIETMLIAAPEEPAMAAASMDMLARSSNRSVGAPLSLALQSKSAAANAGRPHRNSTDTIRRLLQREPDIQAFQIAYEKTVRLERCVSALGIAHDQAIAIRNFTKSYAIAVASREPGRQS